MTDIDNIHMYNINTDLNTNYVQIKLNITLGRFQKQLDYVRDSRTTISGDLQRNVYMYNQRKLIKIEKFFI